MFRKYYKAANDDIKPRRELLDKIFEEADKKETLAKVFRFKPRMGTVLAAVLILVVTAVSLPQIERMSENPEKNVQTESTYLPETEFKAPVIDKTEEKNSFEQKVIVKPNENYIADTVSQSMSLRNNQENTGEIDEGDIAGQNLPESEAQAARTISVQDTEIATDYVVSISDFKEISQEKTEEITALLTEALGEKDEETGYLFIFELVGGFDVEENRFFYGRWRWLLPDGHSSLLTQFVVNETVTELYECTAQNGENIKWRTENNLLKETK